MVGVCCGFLFWISILVAIMVVTALWGEYQTECNILYDACTFDNTNGAVLSTTPKELTYGACGVSYEATPYPTFDPASPTHSPTPVNTKLYTYDGIHSSWYTTMHEMAVAVIIMTAVAMMFIGTFVCCVNRGFMKETHLFMAFGSFLLFVLVIGQLIMYYGLYTSDCDRARLDKGPFVNGIQTSARSHMVSSDKTRDPCLTQSSTSENGVAKLDTDWRDIGVHNFVWMTQILVGINLGFVVLLLLTLCCRRLIRS